MEKRQARIEREMKQLVVPHKKGEIAFAYPSVGPNIYSKVGAEILKQGMKVPIGGYIASLVHSVYSDDSVVSEPEFQEIKEIIRERELLIFNRNLWTKEGVYVVPDPEAIGKSQPLNQNDLEKMLKESKEFNGIRFSRDGKVRFAPKGSYQLGTHSPEYLTKDGFMIASYGTEGAEKLAEVSSKFPNQPTIHGIETDTPEQTVSSLGTYYFASLDVNGNHSENHRLSYAFGLKQETQ